MNRGLKITDSGMLVYDAKGWKSLDINAATGEIIMNGRLGRRDTWSEVFFNNIVYRSTLEDVGPNGEKIGCGLAFNSLEDDWWDGTISLEKASTGDPSLTIQGPIQKNKSDKSPYITVGTAAIAMYTPVGNCSISLTSGGVFFRGAGGYFRATGTEFAYGLDASGGKLWVGQDGYTVRATN